MDPITIGLLAVGAVKAISGAVQKSRANKELKKDMPKYVRPAEYGKLLSIYEQQAGLGQLPGQEGIEADLSARTARGTRAISKYADSPVAAAALTAGLYNQESQAIRDLGIQFADFKNKNMMALARAYEVGANYSDKEWGHNVFYPDQVRRNQAAQKWNAGQQNLWGGIDMMAGAGVDAFGAGGFGGKAPVATPAAAGGPPLPGPAVVGSASPNDIYGYYNPAMANQFMPALGTRVPSPALGSDWGIMGSWTPTK